MCAGALHWSHITKIVFGEATKKKGYSKVNQKCTSSQNSCG